jgi:phosphoribosylformylglycinamidine synthase
VLGICNGFQILCESGLLPGVLLRNKNQKFYCSNQTVKVVNAKTPFTHLAEANQLLSIPVAHAEGRYYCDEPTLAELKKNNQILFQYCDAKGQLSEEANFNGSIESIAGVMNKGGNVFGMMPHPERAAESALFNIDGLNLIKYIFLFLYNIICLIALEEIVDYQQQELQDLQLHHSMKLA